MEFLMVSLKYDLVTVSLYRYKLT